MADLDGELSGDVGEAHGQHGLALAEGARTATEVHILEFGELRNNIMMYVSLTTPTVFATTRRSDSPSSACRRWRGCSGRG